MLNLFQVLNCIYTSKKDCDFIKNEFDNKVSNYLIFQYLCFNKNNAKYMIYLSRFTNKLELKYFVLLCWSIIPKVDKAPFINYLKQSKEADNEMQLILDNIQKTLQYSNREFNRVKYLYIDKLKDKDFRDRVFIAYGIGKKECSKLGVDFNIFKQNVVESAPEIKKVSGLDIFGL